MRKGQKHLEASKIKISLNKIGNSPSWSKGKKHSEKSRLKMSKVKIGKYVGDKNPNWKGGVSKANNLFRTSIENRLWREAVFARDNWTCQECGKKDSANLNAHHIKSFAKYPELRTSIENGKTLCKKCHIKKHSKLII